MRAQVRSDHDVIPAHPHASNDDDLSRPSAAPPSAAQPPPDSQPVIVVMGQPGLDKKQLVDEAISLVGKQDRVRSASFHFQSPFLL